ncbi:hypothetical protein PCO87_15750 [Pectobacteriaceae bacterium C52]|nr:hypothetical protein PCO87_15750 [Pectobacteriaceae bacterium C52]WJY16360.1 hypothetical protein PCO82_06785 [Pectobacteriaceae bacterium CE90]
MKMNALALLAILSFSSIAQDIPEKEKIFIDLTTSAMASSASAKNDMQRGGIKTKRDNGICKSLKSRKVSGWTGIVKQVSANGDGKGVFAVEVAKDVILKTWNNALSDMYDHTLIDPSSKVFDKASNLQEGDRVTFSGEFFKGNGSCIKEGSIRLSGGLEEPEFIFKFSDVNKI